MKLLKDQLKEYASRELNLTGFDQTSFGTTVLNLLDNLADITDNNPKMMKSLCDLIPRLINFTPIAPITENDFEEASESSDDSDIKRVCTRYPYVYQSKDGRYWNDRAVAFRFADSAEDDKIFMYRMDGGSKQEITLPYYPVQEIKIIERF